MLERVSFSWTVYGAFSLACAVWVASLGTLVGGGAGVGVGYGTLRSCPTDTKHCADNWFSTIRLCTDMLKLVAINKHESPSRTVYSNGGRRVSVGMDVGSNISEAVGVIVVVSVTVPSAVGSVRVVPVIPARRLK